MTRVFVTSVEPGGYELDDDMAVITCPKCSGEAIERFFETCDGGSINRNHTIICTECDHATGDLPDGFYRQADHNPDPELDALIGDLGY